jgi:hypothetical protein
VFQWERRGLEEEEEEEEEDGVRVKSSFPSPYKIFRRTK